MSGHGINPIFFNKKNKDWTSRTIVNQPSYVRQHLILALSLTPPQGGYRRCITREGYHLLNKRKIEGTSFKLS